MKMRLIGSKQRFRRGMSTRPKHERSRSANGHPFHFAVRLAKGCPYFVWLVAIVGAVCLASDALAEPPKAVAEKPAAAKNAIEKKEKKEGFVRLVRDAQNRPETLDTAIVHYAVDGADANAVTVDLIGAIHIGDAAYYQQLNREFQKYDVVLYELVAPEGRNVPQPDDAPSGSVISMLQNGMKDLLGLEFQLKEIDYRVGNMVHADMSPDQFAESMKKRGESIGSIIARMIGYELSKRSKSSNDMDILMALFDKNQAMALKRALASQFTDSEEAMLAIDGPSGSTLISGRNEKAMEVLKQQIDAGKKKIAIFYGAAHMPDFEKRLLAEHSMKPVETRWVVAWDMKEPNAAPKPKQQAKDAKAGASQGGRSE